MCAMSSTKKSVHISDLTIKGYRGFDEITIPHLGRVNLFTGKNNTGKSSLLEAVRLLAGNGSLRVVYEILNSREEGTRASNSPDSSLEHDDALQVSPLFNGFPDFSERCPPIVISANYLSEYKRLEIGMDWVVIEEDSDGNRRSIARSDTILGEYDDIPADAIPALRVEAAGRKRIQRLNRPFSRSRFRFRSATTPSDNLVPYQFVGPNGIENTEVLDDLWSSIALTKREDDVVEALQIIESEISRVSIVSSDERPRSRTAIVRAENIPRPVPLRSFGDGTGRLFGIVLSLVNVPGGLLLIDEFENGLHYSVQSDAWRMIFRLARDLDVQVFATTHSKDAVKAFSKVASESPEDDLFVRLVRRSGRIITTVLVEDSLARLLEMGTEVR